MEYFQNMYHESLWRTLARKSSVTKRSGKMPQWAKFTVAIF